MIQDRQIKKLRRLLAAGKTLAESALRTGMTEKTARKYRNMEQLPSEAKQARTYRTRQDPLEPVWASVEMQLVDNPGLQATTILSWLMREQPGRFDQTHLRTVQRRLRQWRALSGPGKEVFFKQVHHPGDLAASDFTDMNRLGVQVGGQRLDHMLYHFVLTYSNWEAITLCYSESFESLSDGLQNAMWKLGAAPRRHRTDRLSAAVNNQCDRREFTVRYQQLMNHYGVAIEKTQANSPHENGDAESLHGHLKKAVDQGRRVYFSSCSLLVQDLLIAKRDLKLSRMLKSLSNFDALMIDDIGYVQQSRDEMEVLFTLLAERYERGSVKLTSNLTFSKWKQIFKDPMTTAAAIDRLAHHSVILELNTDSYRLANTKLKQSTETV